MIYLKAYKKLQCGCIFHAYTTDCFYHCRCSFQCKNCSEGQIDHNEVILEEEFNVNLPFPNEKDYTKLINLGWVEVEKRVDNFKFV